MRRVRKLVILTFYLFISRALISRRVSRKIRVRSTRSMTFITRLRRSRMLLRSCVTFTLFDLLSSLRRNLTSLDRNTIRRDVLRVLILLGRRRRSRNVFLRVHTILPLLELLLMY